MKKTDQPMQSWIAEVCDAAYCLLDADAKASEEDIILVLTQGLTSEFNNFVVTLDATAASDLTLDYVIAHLLNEEAHQGVIRQSAADSALTATSTCHNLQNITCFLCQKKGHYQSHCPQHQNIVSSTPDSTSLYAEIAHVEDTNFAF